MADDGTTDSKSSPEAKRSKPKGSAKSKPTRAKPKAKTAAKPKAKRATTPKAKPKAKRAAKAKPKAAAKPKPKAAAKAKPKAAAKPKPKPKPKPKAAAKPDAKAKLDATLEIASSEATLEARLAATEAGACGPEADGLDQLIAAFRTPEPDPLPPLPVARGRDFVLAMVRDPESAFIYWELTPEGAARARAALGGRPAGLTLRVYLTPEGGDAVVHDYPVEDWIGRYVLTPNAPGQRLVAAVGYKADDAFAHISRATAVELPRRWPKATPLAFTRVVDAPPPRPVITVMPDGTRQIITPPPSATPFVPVPVDFQPAGVDAEAIHTFRIEQAVSGAGPKTDLQRIWGSNHLVPAEGAETDGQHVWGSNHLVRGEG